VAEQALPKSSNPDGVEYQQQNIIFTRLEIKDTTQNNHYNMASYRQIFHHHVLGTKGRKATIPEEHCQDLYKYIWGIVKNKGCRLYRINGIADHIHLLTDLPPTICLADLIKDIKVASSKWMNTNSDFPHWGGWADGYGSFTLSLQEKDRVIAYIKGQKEHHQKESFVDEYKRLLVENGIEFKEEYLFR
jgi:putative transposase